MNPQLAKVVAGLAIAAVFGVALIRSGDLVPSWQDAGQALAAVAVILAAYDRFLWRWIPVPGRPPVLRGTWEMEHAVEVMPPSLRERYPDIKESATTYLRVSQTASTIHARFLFPDGKSVSDFAILDHQRDGPARLLLFYGFDPGMASKQPPRRGAVELEVGTVPHVTLHGKYWNDAGIIGRFRSRGRAEELYDDFEDAKDGQYAPVVTRH